LPKRSSLTSLHSATETGQEAKIHTNEPYNQAPVKKNRQSLCECTFNASSDWQKSTFKVNSKILSFQMSSRDDIDWTPEWSTDVPLEPIPDVVDRYFEQHFYCMHYVAQAYVAVSHTGDQYVYQHSNKSPALSRSHSLAELALQAVYRRTRANASDSEGKQDGGESELQHEGARLHQARDIRKEETWFVITSCGLVSLTL
jgi:hypothetical protein